MRTRTEEILALTNKQRCKDMISNTTDNKNKLWRLLMESEVYLQSIKNAKYKAFITNGVAELYEVSNG